MESITECADSKCECKLGSNPGARYGDVDGITRSSLTACDTVDAKCSTVFKKKRSNIRSGNFLGMVPAEKNISVCNTDITIGFSVYPL